MLFFVIIMFYRLIFLHYNPFSFFSLLRSVFIFEMAYYSITKCDRAGLISLKRPILDFMAMN